VAPGLVFGDGIIPQGVGGTDEGALGSGALRGGAAGDPGDARRGNRGGGVKASAGGRRGTATTGQGRCGQGGAGGAIAGGNGRDSQMDCGTAGDGRPGLCEPSVVSAAQSKKWIICQYQELPRLDPFTPSSERRRMDG